MHYLFLMDPLESVNPRKDTSYAFMLGAHRRGHEVSYLPQGGISVEGGEVEFEIEPVVPRTDPEQPFQRSAPRVCSADEVDAVFIRTDPPFDEAYLMDTWLLDLLPDRVFVMNRPAGIRSTNEKVWATQFAEWLPPTLITRRRERFQAYLEEHGELIAKPTDGYGGMGVFVVRRGDTNAGVIFEMLSRHGSREIIVQRFVPEAAQGDKRILLLEGEPLGAVLRVHGAGEHRNNFFAGGEPQPAEITPGDRQIIEALRPHLVEAGLYFTGIDIIGDRLIEVNVTSPTCLQEMNRLTGQALEDRVIAFVEKQVLQRASTS